MSSEPASARRSPKSELPFFLGLGFFTCLYVGLILALVIANIGAVDWPSIRELWQDNNLRASIRLTLLTCTISAILSLVFAVPIAYLLSRFRFFGRRLIEGILDIPIMLPPLVVGLSLLLLFNMLPIFGSRLSLEGWLNEAGIEVTFAVPAIILAQFSVATAFAVRLLHAAFDQIDPRVEQVARTLGCTRAGAFWKVALPQAGQGIAAAGILAWARALGEFGPILVFAGSTRGRTEVLATSVFLEINNGNLAGAAAVSLLMISIALGVIALIRHLTRKREAAS